MKIVLAFHYAEFMDWLDQQPKNERSNYQYFNSRTSHGRHTSINDVIVLDGFWNRNDWNQMLTAINSCITDGVITA